MAQGVEKAASGFGDELLAILRENPFRDPLLASIREGRMSRAGMKCWVLQAMLVVRQFTRFISAIHANCPHQDGRQLLAENLWEEHGRGVSGRDHLSLILRLARSLGAREEEIRSAEPLAETAAYIDHCFRVTRDGSFIEGMTAIGVGIECHMPAFFGALAALLRERFGLSRADVEYLQVHVGEDEVHARRALEIIRRYADSDESKERARESLREMLEVKSRFAQALYAHCETIT